MVTTIAIQMPVNVLVKLSSHHGHNNLKGLNFDSIDVQSTNKSGVTQLSRPNKLNGRSKLGERLRDQDIINSRSRNNSGARGRSKSIKIEASLKGKRAEARMSAKRRRGVRSGIVIKVTKKNERVSSLTADISAHIRNESLPFRAKRTIKIEDFNPTAPKKDLDSHDKTFMKPRNKSFRKLHLVGR